MLVLRTRAGWRGGGGSEGGGREERGKWQGEEKEEDGCRERESNAWEGRRKIRGWGRSFHVCFEQESGCKGICLNQCKLPAQQFFQEVSDFDTSTLCVKLTKNQC